MTQQEITLESLTAALEAAVEEMGEDYVYIPSGDTCSYAHPVDDGLKPDCMFGNALSRLGVSLDVLHGYDAGVVNQDASSVDDVLGFLGVEDDSLKERAFSAQSSQDNGNPWGEVLQSFKDWGNDSDD